MKGILCFMLVGCVGLSATAATETAIFAGGCFWCMEPPYDKLEGVIGTTSGYTGGRVKNPDYTQVSAGHTGHYEAISIQYDADAVSYTQLLEVFWQNIDPFDDSGQFCDKGPQYRAAIFPLDERQAAQARQSKQALQERIDRPIVTQILPAEAFYPAEDYHQDYYRKNPLRYKYYRFSCGRDMRLEEVGEITGSR
jgi:peptide-methionine (S)-S-oxide reductase